MVLIVGGAYAGKAAYAKARFGYTDAEMLDGAVCDPQAVCTAKCVQNYHLLVKRLLADGQDTDSFTKALCEENPGLVVLLDEIGCGIVPLEKADRIWREAVGRAGCALARAADTVIRLNCGIPTALKGAL